MNASHLRAALQNLQGLHKRQRTAALLILAPILQPLRWRALLRWQHWHEGKERARIARAVAGQP